MLFQINHKMCSHAFYTILVFEKRDIGQIITITGLQHTQVFLILVKIVVSWGQYHHLHEWISLIKFLLGWWRKNKDRKNSLDSLGILHWIWGQNFCDLNRSELLKDFKDIGQCALFFTVKVYSSYSTASILAQKDAGIRWDAHQQKHRGDRLI